MDIFTSTRGIVKYGEGNYHRKAASVLLIKNTRLQFYRVYFSSVLVA
jgi:hypothetical protein